MSDLVEFLRAARTLKAQIEILTKCILSEDEKKILADTMSDLSSVAKNYLERAT